MVELRFEVGDREKHQVLYYWDQMWGRLRITVDDVLIVNRIRALSFELDAVERIIVGYQEQHEVVIVKRRPLLFAGFREQHVTAYVDGMPVANGVGSLGRRNTILVVSISAAIVIVAVATMIAVTALALQNAS